MPGLMKRLALRLPAGWQQALKRHYYAWQIRRGRFRSAEREYAALDRLIHPGDWVIDIGANVGHYTARFSQLVGAGGRVIAFEPVPQTFRLLTDNARLFAHANVTLINAAASSTSALAGMEVPAGATGPYLAHIVPNSALQVLCVPVDGLNLPQRISLVKIDAEGHELAVLRGMTAIIERDRPTLIVEVSSDATLAFLHERGYRMERISRSSNGIFVVS